VVLNPQHPGPGSVQDTSQCGYKVELHLRHVGRHDTVLVSYQRYHS
jgi:hypothetical protein